MNGHFEWIRESGIGCRMGNRYIGGLGYADDLTLMVPSLKGLQSLIHICEDYADEYDVLFNGSTRSRLLSLLDPQATLKKLTKIHRGQKQDRGEKQDFILNTLSDGQPVELLHGRRDVLILSGHCDQPGSRFRHIPQLVE